MILKQSFSRSQTRLCWFWRRRSRNSSSFLAVLLQLSQCSKCSLKLFKFRCILESSSSSSSSMKYLSRERIRRGFGKLSSTPAAASSSNDAPLVGITGLGCPSAQWDCRLPLGFKDRGNSSRLRYCYPLSNNWFYFCGVHSVWKGLCQEKAFGTN